MILQDGRASAVKKADVAEIIDLEEAARKAAGTSVARHGCVKRALLWPVRTRRVCIT